MRGGSGRRTAASKYRDERDRDSADKAGAVLNPRTEPGEPGTRHDPETRAAGAQAAETGNADTENSASPPEEAEQVAAPGRRLRALRQAVSERRERIRHRRTLNTTYRCALGTIGGVVLGLGIVLIPYPGPGWLIVFAGLGILATEFHWASRVNHFAKRHYQRWMHWLARQPTIIKLGVMAGTASIVLVTMWLLGMFDLVGGWFGMHMTWLASPLFGP